MDYQLSDIEQLTIDLQRKHSKTCCGRRPPRMIELGKTPGPVDFMAYTLHKDGHNIEPIGGMLFLIAKCSEAKTIILDWCDKFIKANDIEIPESER
jgi:hypothetical protein